MISESRSVASASEAIPPPKQSPISYHTKDENRYKIHSCLGLKAPEFDLNLLMTARRCQVRRVLCFNFGFGGHVGGIALGKSGNVPSTDFIP